MQDTVGSRSRALALNLAAVLLAAVIAGCGSSSPKPSRSTGGAPRATRGHGTVNVLYAASLEVLMDRRIGPAFDRATGYEFSGYPAGSKELVSEIRGGIRPGDVFISAAAGVNRALEGPANGDWVSWYAPFATTTLVLGYNRSSSFAHLYRTQPWYRVIAEPGFRLGFTDPKLDPKGALAVAALDRAAAVYGEPALRRIATDQSDFFPEQDLVGRLQAGQLDGGFFYTVEATAANIPTVSLGAIRETAAYTVTVLSRAPDEAGAIAFVRFLLGATGRALLRSAGLTVSVSPAAIGTGVPPGLRGVIR